MIRGIKRCVWLVCIIAILTSISSVFATWQYATGTPDGKSNSIPITINLRENSFKPSMPENEVTLLERLYAILNRLYTTPNVSDSRTYLLEETINVEWDYGAAQYVGSMDPDYAVQINELFGDIIPLGVSFILKDQDLNWDGYNEVSMYSTSDPLDCIEEGYNGIVAVYLTVYTPVVDENKNIIAYELVCDSLYGFCNEVHYNPENPDRSSFSTDDWRDNVVYWHHELDTQPMPDNALAIDGVSLFKYHYESYHYRRYSYPEYPWAGYTSVWVDGRKASEVLAGKIPWIG